MQTTKADELALSQGCYYDSEQGDKVIRFVQKFITPQYIKDKFTLLPWQEQWIHQLYSWRLPNGSRRFRTAFLTIAKKQGKTLLTSIIALYELFRPDVPNPLIFSASTSRENAKQIFDQIRNSINGNSNLSKLCKYAISQKIVRVPTRDAEFRSVSTESGTVAGFNCSCAIGDEVWAWRNRDLYDELSQACCGREDGIFIIISTAGSDMGHFYYDLYSKAKRIESGEDLDTSFSATIFETPLEADLLDSDSWKLSNPSIGTSFSEDDLRRTIIAAKDSPSELRTVRQKRLNQWQQPDQSWIDISKWDSCRSPIPMGLETYPAVLGVDLSQTTDPSSVSIVFALPEKRYYVQSWAWVCSDGIRVRERSNLPKFQQFASEGSMVITPGGTIDERAIRDFILSLRKKYRVKQCVFDPNSAYVMAANLEEQGLECLRQPQTHKYFNPSMKDFERAVNEGRIKHNGSSWLRYCLNNVRLDQNALGEIRPSKKKSADHIDGAVSLLLGYGLGVVNDDKLRPMKNPFMLL